MSSIDLNGIATEELKFGASFDEGLLLLKLEGTADHEHDALDAILSKVHEEALGRKANRVRVDVRELEFMSSSCVKAMVVWIFSIQTMTGRLGLQSWHSTMYLVTRYRFSTRGVMYGWPPMDLLN